MNIIHLPPELPGELDLPAINQKLHMGEATLDWSRVEQAPQETIAVLLAGLDLVEHSELLGIATVPDQLSEIILQALTASAPLPQSFQQQPSDMDDMTPAVWEPTPEEQVIQDGVLPVNERTKKYVTAQPLSGQQPHSILQPPSAATLRDELERLVLQDLLGPAAGAEEEVDETNVRDRYLVGMLAPRDQQMAPEEMDKLAIPEEGSVEDGSNDDTALQVASLCPSAIGMSCCVQGNATMLRITPRWGYYKREHSETLKTPKGAAKTIWKRQPMGGESRDIPLQLGAIAPWRPAESEQPDVVVEGWCAAPTIPGR